LRYQSLSLEIAPRLPTHGGGFGEPFDSVKDAIECSEACPSQATGYGIGIAGAKNPRALTRGRVLDRIEAVSPIIPAVR
jgi:hypothetical protein